MSDTQSFSNVTPIGGSAPQGTQTPQAQPPAAQPKAQPTTPNTPQTFGNVTPIGQTPQPGATPPSSTPSSPSDEGFFSRAYQTSGLEGLVDLGKQTLQRPIDRYHDMVAAAKKGDMKTASEIANEFVSGGLTDKNNPLYKAAEQIIMQPVHAIKNQYAEQRKQGEGAVAAAASTAQHILDPATRVMDAYQRTAPRVKADIHKGNIAGAIGDVIGGSVENNATDAVPLFGGAARQVGENLDTDLHAHNYRAALGDVAGPLATAGVGKALGALGEAGEATTGVEPPPAAAGAPEASGNSLTRSAALVKDMNSRAPGVTDEGLSNAVSDTVEQAKTPERMANDMEADAQRGQISNEQQAAQDNYARAHRQINAESQTGQVEAQARQAEAEWQQHVEEESLRNTAELAPGDESITAAAKTAADTANDDMHAKYAEKANAFKEATDGVTIPLEGSGIHDAFTELTGEDAGKGPLVKAVAKSLPGSPQANQMLQRISDLLNPEEPEAVDGQPPPEPTEPPHVDADQLLEAYQRIGKKQRATPWNTETGPADHAIYKTLKEGIIDTLGQLAEASGSPEAIDLVDQMNKDYRENVRLYENPAVKALRSGKLTDVDKYLTGPQSSLGNISTMKQVLGSHWQDFQQSSLRRLVADYVKPDGSIDYKGVLNKLSSPALKPDVRNAMYGNMESQQIIKSLTNMNRASEEASAAAKAGEDAATTAKAKLEGAGKTLSGKTADLAKASEDVTKEQAAKTKGINDAIAHVVGDGDIAKILTDPERRAALQEAVGTDGMQKFGKLAIENQISKATGEIRDGKFVKARFDPDKFLKWVDTFKDSPEAVDAAFRPTPETAVAYDKLISSMQEASSVKKLVKYGVLPPTLGVAGALISGPLAAVVGTLAAVLGEAKFATIQEVLDNVASHPATWRTLGAVGKVADTIRHPVQTAGKAAKAAAPAVRAAAPAAKLATYGALTQQLGGKAAVNKEVVPANPDTGQQSVTLPVTEK